MIVAIRVDASFKIGSGHVMRCLTLANALRGKGNRVFFICSELPCNLINLIRNKQFDVYVIAVADWATDASQAEKILTSEGNVDLLIVDHYDLDYRWERKLRPYFGMIMVIDDLANRQHDCEILLDQNLYPNMESRYSGLIPASCQQLLGPRYALLRPEFINARRIIRTRDGVVRRILIFFGGSDSTNETEKALKALQLLNLTGIDLDVVVGASNLYKEKIREICLKTSGAKFYCQVSNMAEIMAGADLSIGAGGTATWERCYLGLPSIIIAVAENQKKTCEYMQELSVGIYLGKSVDVTVEHIIESVAFLIGNPARIKEIEQACFVLMREVQAFPIESILR